MGIASRLGKYSIISQGGRNPFARTGGDAQKILSPYLRGQPKRTAFYKSDSAPNSCPASLAKPTTLLKVPPPFEEEAAPGSEGATIVGHPGTSMLTRRRDGYR